MSNFWDNRRKAVKLIKLGFNALFESILLHAHQPL